MKDVVTSTNAALTLAQIGWVVKDLEAAQQFFRERMGVKNFSQPEIFRGHDFASTHYGKPNEYESLICQAYSGGAFIEIIQPLSGQSIFHDYLLKNPSGGIQHIAYSTPIANFDRVIAEMEADGFAVVATYDMPIAKIYFFDTFATIGVATEILGITEEGEVAVEKMKNGR
jgi:catechol 2,3-dioxygenase-like lactoylglutathione lyase family enzyme